MSPAPNSSSPGAAPLPPLPNLSSGGSTGGAPGQQSGMAAIISGLAPVKAAVEQIQDACRQIVQSGAVPGSEQACAQIIALSNSLLTIAAQSALQPGTGGGQGAGGIPPVGGGQ